MLRHRLLSLRGYDDEGMMIATRVENGKVLGEVFSQMFSDPAVVYIQIHNAGAGCYNCQANRA